MFMGEVIAFRGRSRRGAPPPPPDGPAQILFFLGVRYSRPDDGPEGKPDGARPSRARRSKRA
jgi:hypothetical protein